jgi:hypothetical protein
LTSGSKRKPNKEKRKPNKEKRKPNKAGVKESLPNKGRKPSKQGKKAFQTREESLPNKGRKPSKGRLLFVCLFVCWDFLGNLVIMCLWGID